MSKWRLPAIVGGLVVVLVVGASTLGYLVFSPPGAQAATTVLSVVSGEVLVQDADAATPRPAVDGEVLSEGDRVITKADSRAVITFFEGSTQELEPDTDVTIQKLDFDNSGRFFIRIGQSLGVTWNSVLQFATSDSRFEVETPAAVASVRDTLFAVSVAPSGVTTVTVRLGSVLVTGQKQEVLATAGTRVTVEPGAPPRQPELIPTPRAEVQLELASAAWLLVVDPVGLAAGIVPPGAPVDQIPMTIATDYKAEPQLVSLTTPRDGIYELYLVGKESGEYHLSAAGMVDGGAVFAQSRQGSIETDERWRAELRVDVEGGRLVAMALSPFARTEEGPPATVITPEALLEAIEGGRTLIPQVAVLGAMRTPEAETATPTPTSVATPRGATATPPPSPTRSLTPTVTPGVTTTPTPTVGDAATFTPVVTATPTPAAAFTVGPTPSPTASPAASPTASPTPSPRASPSLTSTPSPTATPSPTPSGTPGAMRAATATPSRTPSPTPSPTPRPTPSRTPSPTPTPATTVRIGSLTAPAGTAATVRLEATDVPAPGLGKVTIDVTYDPSILSLADCAEDPNGLLDAAVCYLAHRSDVVGFTGIRATPGAIGTLPLADITFEVVGTPGQCSDLHVVVVTFTDPDGGSITAPATDGEICVASAPASVLSGDARPDLRMSVFPVSLDRGHRVFVSEVAACGQQFSGASQGSVALAQGWNAVCYSGATTDVDIATAGISDQISVIYALQADQSWERHVPGRPELSAVTQCSWLGALLVLVAQEGGVTWVFSP